MFKLIFAVVVASVLSACSTTGDTYDKRAEVERSRNEKAVERAIDKAPKWMNELPKSNNAVYANGSAVSRDFSMADMKAKLIAFSSICMAAGGEVDKNGKIYMTDTEESSTERSEVAIRSMCRGVDVSGTEIVETVRVPENGRFRSYVLVSLPTGDANPIVKRKDARRAAEESRVRSDKAFKELDDRR
jgi:hypothetical protein